MATPEELGCDARTAELVRSLPFEQQEIAVEKLRQHLETGKVRNPSAYIRGIINDPEILGLDERALATVKELPQASQQKIVQKFRAQIAVGEIRNPSAWVANAVLNLKKEQGLGRNGQPMVMAGGNFGQPMVMVGQPMRPTQSAVVGGGGGFGFNSLDQQAQSLLRSLPRQVQQDILGKLMLQPHVNNPSAWVAKAALSAGAVAGQSPPDARPADAGFGATEPYDDFDPTVAAYLSAYQLDAGARNLLISLPLETQLDIASKLVAQEIKNPSGWIVKASMQAGAKPERGAYHPPPPPRQQHTSFVGGGQFSAAPPPTFTPAPPPFAPQGYATAPAATFGYAAAPQTFGYAAAPAATFGFAAAPAAQQIPAPPTPSFAPISGVQQLDHGARELLGVLAPQVQQDLLSKMATANPSNPSGWMVKAANSAGARRPPPAGPVSGVACALPPGCTVDEKAQQLLQSLQPHQQRDIILKLTNSWNDGKVQNPSAWVAKAALKAGAASTPGMGSAQAAASAVRYTPY